MSDSALSGPISRRQLLALGGSVAIAGVIVGGSRASAQTGDTTAATAAPGTAAAASGDMPELSAWYHPYGEEGTKEAVERYAAAYTKAKVTVNWQDDYDNALPAALLTDNGPDVFERANGPSIDMIKAGQVVEMTDLFTDEVKADFNQAVLGRVTYDGKIWAIPQMVDMIVFVYRKSMLDQAGVKVPTSMDEMIAAAKTLTSGDVKGLFVGSDGGASEMGGPLLFSAGLNYVTDDGKIGFDDPLAAEALGKLRELYASGSLLEDQEKDWWSAEAFINGACAMQWTGLWTFPDIIKALGDDWGVAAWPALKADAGKPVVLFGAWSSMVNAKSKNVDAAKAYAAYQWIEATADQVDFATAYGYHVPARASLVPQAKPLESGPGKDAADLLASAGHAQNHILWTGKSESAFNDMMVRIVKEGADPAAELAALKPIVEAELAAAMGSAPAGTTPATTPATTA